MVFLHVRKAARIFRPNGSFLGRNHHSAVEGTCTTNLTKLTERKVLRVKGRDVSKFLQGIITNDMNCLTQGHSKMLYTMFLNAQGRALYDAFLYPVSGESNEYFLECDASSSDDVIQHMRKYKLRAKVEVSDASEEMQAWALFSCNGKLDDEITNRDHNFVIQQDTRLDALGMRMIVPLTQSPEELLGIKECITADSAAYKEHRYHLGIAEGMQEVPLGNALPLEYNLAITNGVSFSKGCYIGQELTARTHHTGLIRKRIMPIQLKAEGEMMSHPQFMPQTPIKTNTGKSAGRLCAMLGQYGLGLLRLKEVFNSEYLLLPCKEGNDIKLAASKPNWWPEDLKY